MRRANAFFLFFAATTLVLAVSYYSADRTVHADVTRVGTVRAAAPLLEPRSGHTATLLPNGQVLIAGGMRRNQDLYKSAELYDPATGKFQSTGAMAFARVGDAAVLLPSGKVLVLGGWTGMTATDSAEIFDPATGKFSLAAHMTIPRGQPAATLLKNGDVLITGGASSNSPGGVTAAEIFHSATGTFAALSPMHSARISQTATLLADGRVLLAGGRGAMVTVSAEIYDPATQKFTATGNMLNARYKHAAALLPDGRVLVVGGADERDWRGKLQSAEIYDPRTGKFTATASLADSRFKLPETAVQLSSGQILVAGGSKLVELYNPATGQFQSAQGQMKDARHFMTETRLRDGNVLLTGGYPDNDQGTSDTWLYIASH